MSVDVLEEKLQKPQWSASNSVCSSFSPRKANSWLGADQLLLQSEFPFSSETSNRSPDLSSGLTPSRKLLDQIDDESKGLSFDSDAMTNREPSFFDDVNDDINKTALLPSDASYMQTPRKNDLQLQSRVLNGESPGVFFQKRSGGHGKFLLSSSIKKPLLTGTKVSSSPTCQPSNPQSIFGEIATNNASHQSPNKHFGGRMFGSHDGKTHNVIHNVRLSSDHMIKDDNGWSEVSKCLDYQSHSTFKASHASFSSSHDDCDNMLKKSGSQKWKGNLKSSRKERLTPRQLQSDFNIRSSQAGAEIITCPGLDQIHRFVTFQLRQCLGTEDLHHRTQEYISETFRSCKPLFSTAQENLPMCYSLLMVFDRKVLMSGCNMLVSPNPSPGSEILEFEVKRVAKWIAEFHRFFDVKAASFSCMHS